MKRYGYWKRINQGKALASLAALMGSALVVFLLIICLPGRKGGETKVDAAGALSDMEEICGESRIETLADLKEFKRDGNPADFLSRNSVYVLDEEAVDRYVQTYVAGAESAAMAQGKSIEELIISDWGYESLESYKKAVREEAEDFIKKRLAVYEVAKIYDIAVNAKEYERLLGTYAERFSYTTAEEFSTDCTARSIADEMLYDKTIARMLGKKVV